MWWRTAGTSVALSPGMNPEPSPFTETEEEFFRAGSAMSNEQPIESFSDLDEGYRRPSLWQRLFKTTSR
jgi:hypothetical protein